MSAITITGLVYFISFIGVVLFTMYKFYPGNIEKAKFIYGLRNRNAKWAVEDGRRNLDDRFRKVEDESPPFYVTYFK